MSSTSLFFWLGVALLFVIAFGGGLIVMWARRNAKAPLETPRTAFTDRTAISARCAPPRRRSTSMDTAASVSPCAQNMVAIASASSNWRRLSPIPRATAMSAPRSGSA